MKPDNQNICQQLCCKNIFGFEWVKISVDMKPGYQNICQSYTASDVPLPFRTKLVPLDFLKGAEEIRMEAKARSLTPEKCLLSSDKCNLGVSLHAE